MIVSPISLALREVAIAPRLTRTLFTQCNPTPKISWAAPSRSACILTQQLSPYPSRRQPTLYDALARQPGAARSESTIATPTTTATPQASSSIPSQGASTTAQSTSPALTWNRFLHLRAVRRRFNLAASITTSIATTAGGISFLSQQDMDKLGTLLFGLDPIMAMGVGAVGCGALGWLLGPFAGNAAFSMWYRRLGPDIAVKEREFYQRIKRYRADPSSQSMANPMPDYYGEKISSVQGYRQWLKDQRAFTKKRQSY
ncbi:TIM23 complex component [Xylographa opegraphella]|nr:TIM23 complex component [Xylographa opegraphella]